MRNRYIYFDFDHCRLEERQTESSTMTNSNTKCIEFWKDYLNKAMTKKKERKYLHKHASNIPYNCNKT